jgi:hypothetical protein
MQKSYDTRRYNIASYDQNLCLKPPLMLWVCVLYLSRAVSLPIVIGLGSVTGGGGDTAGLVRGLFGPRALVPSALAFLVLFALAMRSPSAGRAVRWIFARGRILLAVAAMLDAALVLSGVSWEQVQSGDPQIAGSLLGAVLDGYVLVYVLTARRVRDFFRDFPPADK